MKYYVDSERGDDENDGFTPDTAWKTISRVNSSCSHGDYILLSPTQHNGGEINVGGLTFGSMNDEEAQIVIDGWRNEWRELRKTE